MHYEEPGIRVRISIEALQRAAKENLLNAKRARLHEIVAGVACHALTVVLVAWFVDGLARGFQ